MCLWLKERHATLNDPFWARAASCWDLTFPRVPILVPGREPALLPTLPSLSGANVPTPHPLHSAHVPQRQEPLSSGSLSPELSPRPAGS